LEYEEKKETLQAYLYADDGHGIALRGLGTTER
jgi:hypothetical protein